MYSLLLLVFNFFKISAGTFIIDDDCIFVETDPENNATNTDLAGVYRSGLISNFSISKRITQITWI